MALPILGVLAGMGPRSTAPFVELLVETWAKQTGAIHDEEFPEIVILSWPTPFRLGEPVDHARLSASIESGLERLQAIQVSVIGIPCNTAHQYWAQLSALAEVPLINMIEATASRLTSGLKTAVLGTESTLASGVYQEQCAARQVPLVNKEEWQKAVSEIISSLKRGIPADSSWNALCKELNQAGVEQAVIACTDLTPLTCQEEVPLRMIDSSQCLAEALVGYSQNSE